MGRGTLDTQKDKLPTSPGDGKQIQAPGQTSGGQSSSLPRQNVRHFITLSTFPRGLPRLALSLYGSSEFSFGSTKEELCSQQWFSVYVCSLVSRLTLCVSTSHP